MTQDQKRIAIAEACGWKIEQIEVLGMEDVLITPPGWSKEAIPYTGPLPDYFSDLNACHAAVASQPREFQHAFEVMMNHHSSVAGKLFCRMDASDWADIFLQTKRKMDGSHD